MEVTKIPKRTITVIEPKRSLIVEKDKYEQKRVAAYCRVSTDSEEQLTSYNNQMHFYKEMIAANPEWRFAGMYADEGLSGTRADKRPEFTKMINDCLEGKIDYIITKSVSRFARNTVDCLDYVRMLKARGIGIFFEEQNIDTLKSDSELYLIIYAGFAQSESESISKNITWSYRKSFEEGKVVFSYSKMLGYKKGEDGEPEIVPFEAKIVESIFHMYLGGATLREIFETVKDDVAKVEGKKIQFSQQSVKNILLNEKYCGDAILQKSVTLDCIQKKRKKNTGEAPMYYVHNNHQVFVSSCELCIFLIAFFIFFTPTVCSVYLNSKGTIVFGGNRLRIGFGKHSIELLVGSKTFYLYGVLKLSSVHIREVVHQSDGVIERVEAEACGDCFGNGVFYNTTAVESERETFVRFLVVFDIVSTCVICAQISESTCQLFSIHRELNVRCVIAI